MKSTLRIFRASASPLAPQPRAIAAIAASLAAALLIAPSAGCGGPGGSSPPGDGIPMSTSSVCVPLGFGQVSFEVFCGVGGGGADRVCDFVFTSSNPGVVAISPSTVSLRENTTVRVNMTTIGNSVGVSTLSGSTDAGNHFTIGTIRTGC
jgi:hypothetical protein